MVGQLVLLPSPVAEQWLCVALEVALVVACVIGDSALGWGAVAAALVFRVAIASHSVWQLWLAIGSAAFGGLTRWWIGVPLCVCAVALQHILPIPRVRRVTSRPIGRSSHVLKDDSRDNTFFDARDTRKRRVVVSMFYPSVAPPRSAQRADLFDDFDVVHRTLFEVLPAVPNWFSHIARHVNGPSSAYRDVEQAPGAAPLVVLAHGITGPRWQYVSLAEALAEAGYIVAAVEHPFDTACCICYPGEPPVVYRLGRPPLGDRPAAAGEEWSRWHAFLMHRVRDTHDVVVPWLKTQSHYRIDFDRKIGLVGHSFGAAEALELVHRYPTHYNPAVLHDPWLFASHAELRLGRARIAADLLIISSELWNWKRNLKRISNVHLTPQLSDAAKGRRFNLTLNGGGHHNFHVSVARACRGPVAHCQSVQDLALIAPLVGKWLGMLGKHADPVQSLRAVNETTLSFFRVVAGTGTARDLRNVEGTGFAEIRPDSKSFHDYVDFEEHE